MSVHIEGQIYSCMYLYALVNSFGQVSFDCALSCSYECMFMWVRTNAYMYVCMHVCTYILYV